MALSPGTTLGSYTITAKIGEGGMGQVWQATDTKLNRQVALKILPEAFASDPDRLARFQREAQVFASLNHPGIAQIYGIEEADDTRALVLELVEGPTLADRIAKGPIPVDEALPIAKQIAEALEAAHEAGVIHRDLKPANIKLKPDGTVKVLDFGLAKAFQPEATGDPSQSPSLTATATATGVIMGTAAYMAPEQAKGRIVDKRADIWAFGAVLFEMLTGRRAFAGGDVAETLANVIKAEPEWSALPSGLSAATVTYLGRCLQKDVGQRIRDIGDVWLAITGGLDTREPLAPEEPARASVAAVALWRRPTLAISLAVLLATGFALWHTTRSQAPLPRPAARFTISTPTDAPPRFNAFSSQVALSPDGALVVYGTRVSGDPQSSQLYARAVDQLDAVPIPGTERAQTPFFSPDGRQVGFDGQDGTLKRVPVTGGPATMVCEFGGEPRGMSWAPDDTIVFGTAAPSGLWQVAAIGGEPEPLTVTEQGEAQLNHVWPYVLPGGRAVLFTIQAGPVVEEWQIAVLNLDSGEQRALLAGGSNPRYSPSGHIVYGADGELRAIGFDLDRLELTTESPILVERVNTNQYGAASFSLSDEGSLLYLPSGTRSNIPSRSFVWVDREGRMEPVAAEPRPYQEFSLSPDGTKVVVPVGMNEFTGGADLWILDLERGGSTRLTFDDSREFFPTWTHDGSRVAFGGDTLSWKASDGTGDVEVLAAVAGLDRWVPNAFSPDGKLLVFEEWLSELGVLSLEDRVATLLWETPSVERNATLSPDGRWLAYESESLETGEWDVWVRPFPNVNDGRWQLSQGGGRWPLWNPVGNHELFYVGPEGMMSVAVEAEPAFSYDVPVRLFDTAGVRTPQNGGGSNRRVAVSPDGNRFLMFELEPMGDDLAGPILVQGWSDQLTERVPVP